MNLDYKSALIEEITRSKPNLFSKAQLESMSVEQLKKTLDDICEGRIK